MSDEQRIAEIRARVDAAHPSVDFEMMADLVCGQSYRNLESEALAVAMRTCEVTPYTGCGKPMRWVYAYRCRQCGRWMHGPCIDRHFGLVGCPATRDGQAELTAENARLRERVAALGRAGRAVVTAWDDRSDDLPTAIDRLDAALGSGQEPAGEAS